MKLNTEQLFCIRDTCEEILTIPKYNTEKEFEELYMEVDQKISSDKIEIVIEKTSKQYKSHIKRKDREYNIQILKQTNPTEDNFIINGWSNRCTNCGIIVHNTYHVTYDNFPECMSCYCEKLC